MENMPQHNGHWSVEWAFPPRGLHMPAYARNEHHRNVGAGSNAALCMFLADLTGRLSGVWGPNLIPLTAGPVSLSLSLSQHLIDCYTVSPPLETPGMDRRSYMHAYSMQPIREQFLVGEGGSSRIWHPCTCTMQWMFPLPCCRFR